METNVIFGNGRDVGLQATAQYHYRSLNTAQGKQVLFYCVYILVLQSPRWGRESWLLCFDLLVFLVPRDCSRILPHVATGLPAFVIVVFPDHTHLLISTLDNHNRSL